MKVDFDIELAKKKSLDNPVFYVQMGHARLCSILARAEALNIHAPTDLSSEQWSSLSSPDELAITMRLSELPALIAEAAATREPHRVAFYVSELAKDFQSYFTRFKTDPILPRDSDRKDPEWEKKWEPSLAEPEVAFPAYLKHAKELMAEAGVRRG